jgi:prepilin-type processing-associated H-X9-DG protein
MKLASALIVVAATSIASGQSNPLSDLVFTDTKAIGILPPAVVATGDNIQASWSPDGRYLLIASVDSKITPTVIQQFVTKGGTGVAPNQPEFVLTLFNVEKQTSTQVWRNRMDAGRIGGIQWLEGRDQWIVTFGVPVKNDLGPPQLREVIQILNPATGRFTQFYQAEVDEYVSVETALGTANAILVSRRSAPGSDGIASTTLTSIGRDGKLGASITLPAGLIFGGVVWDASTHRPVLRAWQRSGVAKPTQAWFALDFSTSTMNPTKSPSIREPVVAAEEFTLQDGPTTSRSMETTANLKGAWIVANLKGPHQNGLVAAEVDQMSLSPARNAVFYTTKGVGLIRQLATIPKELALKALEAAERTKILNDTKQAALAFIMFASDSDDVLPSPTSDWSGNLQPYLKNSSVLDGFVYQFGGGNMSDVSEPARTELGYKQGPGGRAVAYVDGHVKWIPDP